ncbi:MAG: LPS assembly lipoprotein LptE [Balneolales bacterium]|nr:LPS assembly lipoprotein LptE [Balneolales bacterium]
MQIRSIPFLVVFIATLFALGGCLRYSFTGVSIPSNVSTIYIPFFQDDSGSGLSDLSDQLNIELINRFVNQTRLSLVSDENQADIIIEGNITGYTNRPFSVAGDQTASLNRVQVSVRASYLYTDEERPRWSKSFSGQAEYDPAENPLDGELEAAAGAMQQIAQNMFNDSVGRW